MFASELNWKCIDDINSQKVPSVIIYSYLNTNITGLNELSLSAKHFCTNVLSLSKMPGNVEEI